MASQPATKPKSRHRSLAFWTIRRWTWHSTPCEACCHVINSPKLHLVTPQGGRTMDISQAFAALNGRFVDTVNSHDTRSWAALFAEDAILIPAGQGAVAGRKGIEEWAEVATKVWNRLDIQQGACTSDGDVAWEFGTWTGNINVPDERTMNIG